MNEELTELRSLQHPASKIIYDLFCLFGYVSNTSVFFRIVITSLVSLFVSIGFLAQVVVIVMSHFELAVVIDVVPTIICQLVCLIYLPMGYANRNKYKELVMLLQMNESQKRTENENKIKEKYDRYMIIISTFLTISMFLGSIGLLLPALAPSVLDIIKPLNESRHQALTFQAEYFVDQEKYFYELMLVQYVSVVAILAVLGSVEVIFFMCIIYICGMFEVLGYKLENITSVKQECIHQEEELIFRIGELVESHKIILKLVRTLNMSADVLVIFVLVGTLVIISITLVQVTNPQLITLKSVLLAVAILGQFFMVSLGGQLIINASEKLPQNTLLSFHTAMICRYNSDWCLCSAKVQKYFVFLLMRTSTLCSISPLNTFLICYQNFSTVVQTGVSYAMVLKEMNE